STAAATSEADAFDDRCELEWPSSDRKKCCPATLWSAMTCVSLLVNRCGTPPASSTRPSGGVTLTLTVTFGSGGRVSTTPYESSVLSPVENVVPLPSTT